MQITDVQQEEALKPLLRQAFRPLFLFGALFSLLAMLLWGLALSGLIALQPYGDLLFWHQHEMLFGFVAAIIVGFLLTAVQNWTGLRATHGGPLLWLTLVWLAARALMLLGGSLPGVVVAAVDLAFLPLAALLFGRILLKAGQSRNLFFVPVLLLLTACNALMHAGVILEQPLYSQHGMLNTIWLITLVMAIVSGRVLPMFTANGTQTPRIEAKPWLDNAALGALWLIFALHFVLLVSWLPANLMALLYATASLLCLWRLLRVKIWLTFRVPLLWSLHIACYFIPVGLALFAAKAAGLAVSQSTAIHALTAGAMGVMILAMMARVSLGHTGRMLQPKPVMAAAFVLLIAAVMLRVLTQWLPGFALYWYQLAIGGWVLAFGCYCLVYWPVLTTPRADGRPG
ncbi:NnrS family protein [Alkalimonas delamerensis]|uniref:NnrS family protein n=1 Tax=Alkalimonas delamerensis TaxID=265981 RepID=A0ABT9GN76_9GAMM|nr:NnrS family protein [Alkalimonas delamerensis]MDP4528425.1 NnrS family protein [Alkalimonas delamerensis]